MSTFHKYTDIEGLHKVPDVLIYHVVVQEKVHGTNMRFGMSNGCFYVGGRNQVFIILDADTPIPPIEQLPKADFGFTKWVIDNNLHVKVRDLYPDTNIIFHGEWLGKGIQKEISYADDKQFWCFDVRVDEDFLPWEDAKIHIQKIEINQIPVYREGKVTVDDLNGILKLPSLVAAMNNKVDMIEGVVVKPLTPKRDVRGNWIYGKYKNTKFSETKSGKQHPAKAPAPESAVEFVEEFTTRNRLMHVLDKLKEREVDISGMNAMGPVMQGMQEDILKEGKEEFEKIDIEWKIVSKLISTKTRTLFVEYLNESLKDIDPNLQIPT